MAIAPSLFFMSRNSNQASSQAQSQPVVRLRPDHINHFFLFNRMDILKKKGMPLVKRNELLKKELKINDEQTAALDQIATLALVEAQGIDAKAAEIIRSGRAKYARSKTLPPIPFELLRLQEQRDAVFINARASLERLLGNSFASFNDNVKKQYGETIANSSEKK
jgi:hypothetical protein